MSKILYTSVSRKDTTKGLIKVPSTVLSSIIRYSTTFGIRQVDNYYNLVQQSESQNICMICLETYTATDVEKLTNCQHTFCHQCLHNYLIYQIHVCDQIECPSQTCKETISKNETCFQHLPNWAKQRYDKIKLWKQNMSNSNSKLCPTTSCKGTININDREPKCDTCHTQFCKECHLKQHDGICQDNYHKNFREWRRCPSCKEFIEKTSDSNRMFCLCKTQFCFVCQATWSDDHQQCNQVTDPMLDRVYNRKSIMQCCRCYNITKGIFFVFLLPFIFLFAGICIIITLLVSTIGGFIFSPCYARTQGYSYPATIFCCPCFGIYAIGYAINHFLCESLKIACDHLKRYCITIRALFCYSGHTKTKDNHTGIEF